MKNTKEFNGFMHANIQYISLFRLPVSQFFFSKKIYILPELDISTSMNIFFVICIMYVALLFALQKYKSVFYFARIYTHKKQA